MFSYFYFYFTDKDSKAFTDVVNLPKEVKLDGCDSRASVPNPPTTTL